MFSPLSLVKLREIYFLSLKNKKQRIKKIGLDKRKQKVIEIVVLKKEIERILKNHETCSQMIIFVFEERRIEQMRKVHERLLAVYLK